MNRVVVGSCLGLMLLAAGGCKHAANSEIVAKFQAAGGGDPAGATAQQIGVWMSNHDAVRKDLAPACVARQKTAPADWANSDEGRICTGVMQASMFAPYKFPQKGTKF